MKVNIDDLIVLLEREKALGAKTIQFDGSLVSLVETDSEKEILLTTNKKADQSVPATAYIDKSKVIQKIANDLIRSTETSWTEGYLDDWASHAKKMKTVIQSSVPILNLM